MSSSENTRPQAPAALKVALGLVILFLVVNLFLHVLKSDEAQSEAISIPTQTSFDEPPQQLNNEPLIKLLDSSSPPSENKILVNNVDTTSVAATTEQALATPNSPAEIKRIKQQAQTIQVPVMAIVDDIPKNLQENSAYNKVYTQPKPIQTKKVNESTQLKPVAHKSPSHQATAINTTNTNRQTIDKAKAYHESLHQQANTKSSHTPRTPVHQHNQEAISRIYLHIRSNRQARKADKISNILRQYGFNLPAKELLNKGPSGIEVRYFRSSDLYEAQHIAQIMSENHLKTPKVKLIKGYANKVRPRQFEIWFGPNT